MCVGIAVAQNAAPAGATGWRNASSRVASRVAQGERNAASPAASPAGGSRVLPAGAIEPARAGRDDAAEAAPPRPIAVRPVSEKLSADKLPSDQGQVWQEYDISAFTSHVTTTKRPEQLVIDWILRDTGYEPWHSSVVSVLSADARTLRVYHTPEMQRVVASMVDRFVNQQQATHAFGLRVVTIGSPNWRETALSVLKPIPVQSQGVQAWLLNKEDAALLLAQMSKRSDFREYSSPQLLVYHGQSIVLGSTRPKQYARSIISRPGTFPPYEIEMGRIDEGYSLELSPLVSTDGATVDAVLKCNINQIEKMVGMSIDIPLGGGASRRERIEVPQMTSCDLHERFRWPTDQVLLVSRGVVATPAPSGNSILPITLPGAPSANRADALVFVQSRGKVDPPAAAPLVLPPAGVATSAPAARSASQTTQFRARR
jgi:hypothetical protein